MLEHINNGRQPQCGLQATCLCVVVWRLLKETASQCSAELSQLFVAKPLAICTQHFGCNPSSVQLSILNETFVSLWVSPPSLLEGDTAAESVLEVMLQKVSIGCFVAHFSFADDLLLQC